MNAPLLDNDGRAALIGAVMLAGLEAELLDEDPILRGQLAQLAKLLAGWAVSGDQAVAVHLRLADLPHDGYVPADLARAIQDHREARGFVLGRIREIIDHLERP